MEILEAIRAVLYALMSATEKLTEVALVMINRRRRALRHPQLGAEIPRESHDEPTD